MNSNKKHLPILGIGPMLGLSMVVLTVIGIVLAVKNIIPGNITILSIRIAFLILGILLIIEGLAVFIGADLGGGLVDSIKKNQLKTNGSYQFVRNPCYCAYFLACCGAICIMHNLVLLILPIFLWAEMTIVLINTEEKWLKEMYGQEYIDYCKRVNRCIPWFPKRRKERNGE